MKKLILCFFCCICLISCKSTVHLPIPGESAIKQNNIYSEYMSIGDAYLDLEKFDKAITYYHGAKKPRNPTCNSLHVGSARRSRGSC